MEFKNLQKTLDMLVEEYNTPCVDCSVHKEHKEIFRYYKGLSDIENNKKINGEELYLIFSMTKMLTCTCALQLFEQGKYLMDDPISMYLEEFKQMNIADHDFDEDNSAEITKGNFIFNTSSGENNKYAKNPIRVVDLFTMGAGLDYDLNAEGIKNALAEGKKSTRDLVRALSKTVLGCEPGTRFRYSLCHDVLGALIEVWSGMKFSDYMKENLLKPLGMDNTFFGDPKDDETISKMAARYRFGDDKKPIRLDFVSGFQLSDEYESGGAGLVSCVKDYATFLDALANGGVGKNGNRILSISSVELMRTNHMTKKQIDDFDNCRKGYGYGLGVRTHIDPEKSGSLSPLGEFGWDGAAGAFSMVDLQNKLSLTYFQQIHNWDLNIQTLLRNALYTDLKENNLL